jgi:aspartyl-tRNA(Asn)/glutamyl-tRNA(Gln) amidotransferase subunit A
MNERPDSVDTILRAAAELPGLRIDRSRAIELAAEIAALSSACTDAADRFETGTEDDFATELLRAWPAATDAGRVDPHAAGPRAGASSPVVRAAADDPPDEVEAILAGQVSSEAATHAALERIATLDAVLRCFVRVDARQALERARELDRERAGGRIRGSLHGVPLAIKDLFERPGRSTSAGGIVYSGIVGRRTATVVRRLESAGAVCVGTLNLDEFAAGGTGDNPHYGRCRNPWDPERITGGSSSGSAAAVAAGMVPIALGSDTGGSIRLPAAFCGVTALKPGWGRVSRSGAFERAAPFDSVSPAARSAADCRRLFECIAGPDPDDPATLGMPAFERAAFGPGLRLGVVLEPFAVDADPRVFASVREGLDALCALGLQPQPLELPDLAAMTALHQIVVKSRAAQLHREALRTRADQVSLAARSAIEAGLFLDPELARQALSLRAATLRRFRESVFGQVDLLLLPVVGQIAPPYASLDGAQAAEIQRFFARSATALRFVNWLGLPALSLPCAPVQGLPTGLQLIGPPLSEARLLAVGEALQRTTPWHRARPQLA